MQIKHYNPASKRLSSFIPIVHLIRVDLDGSALWNGWYGVLETIISVDNVHLLHAGQNGWVVAFQLGSLVGGTPNET